jgi:hypothetical protein
MGMFDFLFGSKPASTVEELNDRIWITQRAKWNGIRQELQERLKVANNRVLFLAHFPDALVPMKLMIDAASKERITVLLADALTVDTVNRLNLDPTATIDLLIAERHPLPDINDKLILLAKELPCRCRVAHHVSLEDPILKLLAGDWVRDIVGKLGMPEDERIESRVVDRHLKKSQQKIQEQAFGNAAANSATEWIERNLPNGFQS